MTQPMHEDIDVRDHLSDGLTRDRVALELRRSAGAGLILVAFVACCVIVGGVIVRNVSGGSPLADRYRVRVAVSNASGVRPGTQEVRISGVPVGTIESSDFVDGRAVLTASIERRHGPIYRNALLRLRPQTPLQDLYLDVVNRGDAHRGPLTPDDVLAADRTSVAVEVRELLEVFDPPTRARMERFIDSFGGAIGGDGDRLRAAFVEIAPFLRTTATLTRVTARRRQMTRRLVRNLRLMLDELARRDNDLRGLVSGGAATFSALHQSEQELEALIAELPPTLRQTRATFATLAPSLDRAAAAFTALRPVADDLPPALQALTGVGRDGRLAFSRLRRPIKSLQPLLRAARPFSRSLVPTFDALRSSAPRLDRVTALVVPCRTALRQFFNWTMSVFKFQDVMSAYPRGEAVGDRDPEPGPSCAPGKVRPDHEHSVDSMAGCRGGSLRCGGDGHRLRRRARYRGALADIGPAAVAGRLARRRQHGTKG